MVERPVDRTELYVAGEIFMVGTAAEVLTIGSVDRYTIGDGGMGPITTQLEQLFHDVVRGKNPALRPLADAGWAERSRSRVDAPTTDDHWRPTAEDR